MNKRMIASLGSVFFLAVATLLAAWEYWPEPERLDFHTRTVAVCDYGEDSVYCYDSVQVFCNGEVYFLNSSETVECGTLSLSIPALTAFAVFDSGWKDPRLQ